MMLLMTVVRSKPSLTGTCVRCWPEHSARCLFPNLHVSLLLQITKWKVEKLSKSVGCSQAVH